MKEKVPNQIKLLARLDMEKDLSKQNYITIGIKLHNAYPWRCLRKYFKHGSLLGIWYMSVFIETMKEIKDDDKKVETVVTGLRYWKYEEEACEKELWCIYEILVTCGCILKNIINLHLFNRQNDGAKSRC